MEREGEQLDPHAGEPLPASDAARLAESLDAEENTLRPDFVRRVADAVEAGDRDAVYALVEPLHPADIADLFELLDRSEERRVGKECA